MNGTCSKSCKAGRWNGAVLSSGLAILMLMAGCQSSPSREPVRQIETVEVQVPVAVRMEPPAELMQPYVADELPTWIPPADHGATSALTQDGEQRLRLLIHDLLTRDEAWREWASETPEN